MPWGAGKSQGWFEEDDARKTAQRLESSARSQFGLALPLGYYGNRRYTYSYGGDMGSVAEADWRREVELEAARQRQIRASAYSPRRRQGGDEYVPSKVVAQGQQVADELTSYPQTAPTQVDPRQARYAAQRKMLAARASTSPVPVTTVSPLAPYTVPTPVDAIGAASVPTAAPAYGAAATTPVAGSAGFPAPVSVGQPPSVPLLFQPSAQIPGTGVRVFLDPGITNTVSGTLESKADLARAQLRMDAAIAERQARDREMAILSEARATESELVADAARRALGGYFSATREAAAAQEGVPQIQNILGAYSQEAAGARADLEAERRRRETYYDTAILPTLAARRGDVNRTLAHAGEVELRRLRDAYRARQGQAMQQLADAGLMGGTIAPTISRGLAKQQADDARAIMDQWTRLRAEMASQFPVDLATAMAASLGQELTPDKMARLQVPAAEVSKYMQRTREQAYPTWEMVASLMS